MTITTNQISYRNFSIDTSRPGKFIIGFTTEDGRLFSGDASTLENAYRMIDDCIRANKLWDECPRIAVAVIVKGFLNPGDKRRTTRWVPLALIQDDEDALGEVEKVVWQDGSTSWGTCWYWWTGADSRDESGNHVYARIGAGAYGDQTVWTNQTLYSARERRFARAAGR